MYDNGVVLDHYYGITDLENRVAEGDLLSFTVRGGSVEGTKLVLWYLDNLYKYKTLTRKRSIRPGSRRKKTATLLFLRRAMEDAVDGLELLSRGRYEASLELLDLECSISRVSNLLQEQKNNS